MISGKVTGAPVKASAPVAVPAAEVSLAFDYSQQLKKEDFPCWGTYEAGNKECEACPFKADCSALQK